MAEDDNNTPPPSPEYPSPDNGNGDSQEQMYMMRSGPSLGSGPGKVIAFGAIMLVVVGFVLYTLFAPKPQPTGPASGTVENPSPVVITPPVETVAPPPPVPTTPVVMPPPPPPPPPPPTTPIQTPVAPTVGTVPPPPPPPPIPNTPPTAPTITALNPITSKEEQQRLRSSMLVMDGGRAGGTAEDKKAATSALEQGDPNKAFASNVLKSSASEKTVATKLSNLNQTVAQGKIIDAVIETAVNTDLPGTLRAVVSRDVYAESGRGIMIPKGSRLLGTYNTGVSRGQRRVMIVWTRLIRPDGVDMQIGSPGIDALGRAGVEGAVDNKYSEIFSSAILTSILGIGVAIATDSLSNQNSTTTTNANGTTSSGTSASLAGGVAVGNIGSIGKDIVGSMLDLRPTLTIDQGTRIDVFVNKDLVFPNSVLDSQFLE